jgi:hypothetical protein
VIDRELAADVLVIQPGTRGSLAIEERHGPITRITLGRVGWQCQVVEDCGPL